jgi:hypothetical protein
MAEGIMTDLVVGVRAEGMKTEVGRTGFGRTWGVVELGATAGLAVSFIIYKTIRKFYLKIEV